jgi:phosphoglycerate dehydrogenase-like enzyme
MNKMKVAILGSVHQRGWDFLRENKFEVFEVENFEIENLKKELEFVDGILLRTSKLNEDVLSNCKNCAAWCRL